MFTGCENITCHNLPLGIGHFTVVCLVPWPLNRREAGGDLVLLQTCLLSSANRGIREIKIHVYAKRQTSDSS